MPISASTDTPVTGSQPAISLRKTLLRGFAGVGVTRVVQMLLSLLVSVVLARALGPEQFGHYSLIIAVIGLCALPAYAGFAPLLVREVARFDATDTGSDQQPQLIAALRQWALRCTLLLAGAGVLGFGVFYTQTNTQTNLVLAQPYVIGGLLCCAVVAIALTRFNAALLQGMHRVVVATLPETIVRPATLTVLLGVLLLAGALDISAALLCYSVAVICAWGYARFLLRGSEPQLASPVSESQLSAEVQRWRAAVWPFTGIAAIGYLNTELFVPLVAWLADPLEVAYFKIALSLAILIGMPLTLVESVIKPTVTRLYELSDGRRLQQLVGRSGWAALGVSVPLLACFILFGERLVVSVFGEAYVAVTQPMIILGVGFAIVNLVGPSMQLLYATRFEKDALVISLLSLACVVLGSLAMIPMYGAVGGACVFATAKVVRALAFRFWAARRLHSLFNAVQTP